MSLRLGYTKLNVEDLAAAVELFEGSGPLQLNGMTDERAFLRSAGVHHWIERRRDPSCAAGLVETAFEMDPGATCGDVEKALRGAGIGCTHARADFVQDTLRFPDTDGTEVEAFHGMAGIASRMRPKWAKLERIVHVAGSAPDVDDALASYTAVLEDLIRHRTSGSIGFYFNGLPDGLGSEFCFEHGSVDPATRRPRTFVRSLQATAVYEPQAGY